VNRIAEFKKISKEQFLADGARLLPDYSEAELSQMYEDIRLPKRATSGSAGYDFYIPCPIKLMPNETITIPTGIRAMIDDGWFLMCCPRSGLGFKYRLRLDNTVGIIDSDYFGADNEGHIQIRITNESNSGKILELKASDAFAQGIFMPFGITVDDAAEDKRSGGFGSTSAK